MLLSSRLGTSLIQDLLVQGDEMSYFEVMTPNLVTHNKYVLGIGWDTLTDEFVFHFEDILNKCAQGRS